MGGFHERAYPCNRIQRIMFSANLLLSEVDQKRFSIVVYTLIILENFMTTLTMKLFPSSYTKRKVLPFNKKNPTMPLEVYNILTEPALKNLK